MGTSFSRFLGVGSLALGMIAGLAGSAGALPPAGLSDLRAAVILPASPSGTASSHEATVQKVQHRRQWRGGNRSHGRYNRGWRGNRNWGRHNRGWNGSRYHRGWYGNRYDRRWNRRYARRHNRGWYGNGWYGGGWYGNNWYGNGLYLGFSVPAVRYVEPYYDDAYIVEREPLYRESAIGSGHVQWCYNRYRSYRASDNTFQPYNGPRRQCYSPYD